MPEPNNRNWRELFRFRWNPQPLNQPKVDPNIETLHPLTRSAEAIRFSILSLEWWLSPEGALRCWIRNHTKLAVVLAIPAFLILPVVTFALWQIVSWSTALISITGRLIIFPVLLLLAVAGILIAVHIIKVLFGCK